MSSDGNNSSARQSALAAVAIGSLVSVGVLLWRKWNSTDADAPHAAATANATRSGSAGSGAVRTNSATGSPSIADVQRGDTAGAVRGSARSLSLGARSSTPTVTYRQRRNNTPPSSSSSSGANAQGDGGLRSAAGSATDARPRGESPFDHLASQLEWADAVLGAFIQYPTDVLVLVSEERQQPLVHLKFTARKSHESPFVSGVSLCFEQAAPLAADRGCIGSHRLEPVETTSRQDDPLSPMLPHADGDAAPTPERRRDASNNFSALTADTLGPAVAAPAMTLEQYTAQCIDSFERNPCVRLALRNKSTVRIPIGVPAGQPLPSHRRDYSTVDYTVIPYGQTRAPSDAAVSTHGLLLLAAHPFVDGVFVAARVTAQRELKAHPLPRVAHTLLTSVCFSHPAPSPSYLALAEPRYGTAFRLPLPFGLHRTPRGPDDATSSDSSAGSDDDDRRTANSSRRAAQSVTSRQSRPQLSSRRSVGGRSSTGTTRQSSAAGAAARSARRSGAHASAPKVYALAACADCAVYASIDARSEHPVLADAVEATVRHFSNALALHPPFTTVDAPAPTQPGPDGTPPPKQQPSVLVKTKLRHFAVSRMGDAAWYTHIQKNQIAQALRTSQGLANGDSNPAMAKFSAAVDVCTGGKMSTVVQRPGSPVDSCRFAFHVAALPGSNAVLTLWFVAQRSVSRDEFADVCSDAIDTLTLRNHRGQAATVHYVSLRHGFRLLLPRRWHVTEPVLGDPAAIFFKAADPPAVPPFLASPTTAVPPTPVHAPANPSGEGGAPPGGSTPPIGPQFRSACFPDAASALPIITCRVSAAPPRGDLIQAEHDAAVQGAMTWQADAPADYATLWVNWALRCASDVAMADAAAASARGSERVSPSLTHRVLQIGGMKALLIEVHTTVALARSSRTSSAQNSSSRFFSLPPTETSFQPDGGLATVSTEPSTPPPALRSASGSQARGVPPSPGQAASAPPRRHSVSLASAAASTYNPFVLPPLDMLAATNHSLNAALASHNDVWQAAFDDDGASDNASDARQASSRAGASPNVGPQRGTPVALCSQVRFMLAVLPPLWHQQALHHASGVNTAASDMSAQAYRAMDPAAPASRSSADESDPAYDGVDRATMVFQSVPVPSTYSAQVNAAMLQLLNRLELQLPQ